MKIIKSFLISNDWSNKFRTKLVKLALPFRRGLILSLMTLKADLISVRKKVHVMKWLFIYRRDLVVCYVLWVLLCFVGFIYTFISSKYDFHVDAERMIV